jgi:hypothetical protein
MSCADVLVQDALGREQENAWDQMRVDVSRFVVAVEPTGEAAIVGSALGTVS